MRKIISRVKVHFPGFENAIHQIFEKYLDVVVVGGDFWTASGGN